MLKKYCWLNFLCCLLVIQYACSSDANKSTFSAKEVATKTAQQAQPSKSSTHKNAYFGDLHVHTNWSFDAFIFGVKVDPDDAYRFGKGEAIDHVGGQQIKIKRPLDFMAVTEHAEYMGLYPQMLEDAGGLANSELAKSLLSTDRRRALAAFSRFAPSFAQGKIIEVLENKPFRKDIWKRVVAITEKHNNPGTFTTFPGYEYSVTTPTERDSDNRILISGNLHRNVIFKSSQVPELPFSNYDSRNPENLWKWMDQQRAKGIEVMSIPHNANKSDGLMYQLTYSDGRSIDREYVKLRMRNEPINEVSQVKGSSMVHPSLSPDDDFADFEIADLTFGSTPRASTPQGSYVRQALKDGLTFQKNIGANPYQFGFIGSSDSHNGSSPVAENNYSGKLGFMDGSEEHRRGVGGTLGSWVTWSAGSLAGVWATENTRAAIFDAMQRKETFATSGPRIKVRMYGSWQFPEGILEQENWASISSKIAAPMGSNLPSAKKENKAPSFLVSATKDAESGNLDRIQIIKGWTDADGKTQEKIYNVVWSGDRMVDAKGKLTAIGSTVDVKTASYENSIGAVSLQTIWTDPAFDGEQEAFYYARVLEIPTPRWSTYDAKALGMEVLEAVPAAIQERAWSSPIWYSPAYME